MDSSTGLSAEPESLSDDSGQSMPPAVAVVGAGSWGTALAIQLARSGARVKLWGRDQASLEEMREQRCNERYLPGARFPDSLTIEPDFSAIATAERVLVSVPSHAFRRVLQQLLEARRAGALSAAVGGAEIGSSGELSRVAMDPAYSGESLSLAWATKGFEQHTGLLPHQVVREVLPGCRHYAVVSGPTFAREVGEGLPTAITVAGSDPEWSASMADALRTRHFIAYTSDDIIGVEIGGAVKNALAIGAGLSDGLGFGANARIALINRGLRELSRLGMAMGAKQQTFMGLAGMGDLVLTCTDDQSRNRRMGLALARGASIDEAQREIGQVVEGVTAAQTVYEKAMELGVRMPIIEQIHRIVVDGVDPQEAVAALLDRELNAGSEH